MRKILILGCLLMAGICKGETLIDLGESEITWEPTTLHLELNEFVLDCHGVKLTIPMEFMDLGIVKRIEFYIQSSSKTVVFIKQK